jgi:hypothetical protein
MDEFEPFQISPSDSRLPTLDLPPGSHSRSWTTDEYNINDDLPEIEPIEHRLRLDFIKGGPVTIHDLHGPTDPLPRQYAVQTISDIFREMKQYYPSVPHDSQLADAPAALRAELSPHYRDIESIQAQQRQWYFEDIPKNLDRILETVESLFPISPDEEDNNANTYCGVVVVPDDTNTSTYADEHDLTERFIIHEDALDDQTSLSTYRISLPAPLLIGDYRSDHRYSLIPWSDALVCACPYKQLKPAVVMCKHELAATIRLAQSEQYILPVDEGFAVPQRARRIISPLTVTKHTPQLPDEV